LPPEGFEPSTPRYPTPKAAEGATHPVFASLS